ncbi:hypothetical protein CspHIS471_0301320 [Cutaneotrichosporon sp. HIS471]|nr:hypothetical protein CspHIS471_0301320 [Cutaneotrichosporon sp. HIS471]
MAIIFNLDAPVFVSRQQAKTNSAKSNNQSKTQPIFNPEAPVFVPQKQEQTNNAKPHNHSNTEPNSHSIPDHSPHIPTNPPSRPKACRCGASSTTTPMVYGIGVGVTAARIVNGIVVRYKLGLVYYSLPVESTTDFCD